MPQLSLTHGGAALQIFAKLLAPIKQSQIYSEGGGENSIVYFPLTGTSNISTYDKGENVILLSVNSNLCIYLFVFVVHT